MHDVIPKVKMKLTAMINFFMIFFLGYKYYALKLHHFTLPDLIQLSQYLITFTSAIKIKRQLKKLPHLAKIFLYL
ncbi:MAG: hypothetical protein JWN78_2916 [Bacteroidota bacterium]|nr:hypothetical protein [Bacteroidota bacterium]